MLQITGAAVAAALIGYIILHVFVDGIFQDPFANFFVALCKGLGFSEFRALWLYQVIFRDNKTLFIMAGLLLLLLVSCYLAMSRFSKYLNQIGTALDRVFNETNEPVELPGELRPMELKLNTIKATLKQRQQDATQAEQRKNDLVVYLAHDLKTPLTSIIGYLSLLDEAPDMPAEQRARYVNISLEKAYRLEELINEFFEITRFNVQNIVLEKQPVNVSMMLEQLVDEFYPTMRSKSLSCSLTAGDNISVMADADKLARVFDNLLRNAVAYSFPNTAIEVEACVHEDSLRVFFRNKGRPIPAHKLESIFEKFYRVDSSRSTQTGGSGLGLAIAKELVTLHGGSIHAVSNAEYTQFTVQLPL